MQILIEN